MVHILHTWNEYFWKIHGYKIIEWDWNFLVVSNGSALESKARSSGCPNLTDGGQGSSLCYSPEDWPSWESFPVICWAGMWQRGNSCWELMTPPTETNRHFLPVSAGALTRLFCDWSCWEGKINKCSETFLVVCMLVYVCPETYGDQGTS